MIESQFHVSQVLTTFYLQLPDSRISETMIYCNVSTLDEQFRLFRDLRFREFSTSPPFELFQPTSQWNNNLSLYVPSMDGPDDFGMINDCDLFTSSYFVNSHEWLFDFFKFWVREMLITHHPSLLMGGYSHFADLDFANFTLLLSNSLTLQNSDDSSH